MYEYIKGELTELTPTLAIMEAAGVGYMLHISLYTFSQIEGDVGESGVKLYTHYVVREDAQLLYGFSSKSERELFKLLISVSGVGGNTARMVLSTFSPTELQGIIATENAVLLKSVKGLGLKTAQKIIVDLSGKMLSIVDGEVMSIAESSAAQSSTQNEAVEALVMLGFSKANCQKMVSQIVKANPSMGVEEAIREALKRL